MARAIVMFFNLLVLVIICRIFAPGLASGLIELATNAVALANEAVVQLHEQSTHLTTDGTQYHLTP